MPPPDGRIVAIVLCHLNVGMNMRLLAMCAITRKDLSKAISGTKSALSDAKVITTAFRKEHMFSYETLVLPRAAYMTLFDFDLASGNSVPPWALLWIDALADVHSLHRIADLP